MSGDTPAARQARIEEQLKAVQDQLKLVLTNVQQIKDAQDKDIAALAAWENKGRGLLIGVAVAAAGMGAVVSAKIGALIMALAGVFK